MLIYGVGERMLYTQTSPMHTRHIPFDETAPETAAANSYSPEAQRPDGTVFRETFVEMEV